MTTLSKPAPRNGDIRGDQRSPTQHRSDGRPLDGRTLMARAVLRIIQKLMKDSAFEVVLDEGHFDDALPEPHPATARLIIRGRDALSHLLFPPSVDAFGDAFLRGDLDIEGDLKAAIAAAGDIDLRNLDTTDVRRLLRWGLALRRGADRPSSLRRKSRLRGRRHSRARDMEAIRFHYDVGEAFYSVWLDRRLTYSCAYFPDGTIASEAPGLLDIAQEAKLDLIARKLGASSGMRMLDIGSGWGSLVDFVAEHHGAEAVGITLSRRQTDEANARARDAGLGHVARSEVRDYRDLAPLGAFDIVASVGMFEHVGRANLPDYFRAAYEALRPGGLFLNHGIAMARQPGSRWRRAGSASHGRFVDRYVFPDGELVTIDAAMIYAREAGFEVIEVQSLRPHYALTLAAWVSRLEDRWDEAVAAAGEEVARTWRLYLSAARLGFERDSFEVYQMLLARPRGHRAPATLPLRPWW